MKIDTPYMETRHQHGFSWMVAAFKRCQSCKLVDRLVGTTFELDGSEPPTRYLVLSCKLQVAGIGGQRPETSNNVTCADWWNDSVDCKTASHPTSDQKSSFPKEFKSDGTVQTNTTYVFFLLKKIMFKFSMVITRW